MSDSMATTGPARTGRVVHDSAEIAATLGVGREVALQKEAVAGQHWAAMAGWVMERAVILDGPRGLVTKGMLFRGNPARLRYLHLGVLYGFATTVLQVWRNPLLVVLSWPEALEVMTLGADRRVAVSLATTLTLLHPGGRSTSFPAQIEDLSGAGCRVRLERNRQSDRRFEPGSQVTVNLELPGLGRATEMRGEVRNVMGRAGFIGLGVKFHEDGQLRQREAIAALVERQI